MNLVKLTGLINNTYSTESILKKAVENGALKASIISREIAIELPEERVEDMKRLLEKMKISEVKIREHSRIETTICRSSSGEDPKKIVRVTISPGTRLTGIKPLSIIIMQDIKEKLGERSATLNKECSAIVRETIARANITDALFSVRIRKHAEDYTTPLKLATINAIEEADGITQIN